MNKPGILINLLRIFIHATSLRWFIGLIPRRLRRYLFNSEAIIIKYPASRSEGESKREGLPRGSLLLLSLMSFFSLAQQTAPKVIKLEDTIRGNQEQPKVLTIVPWQAASVKHTLPSQIVERINKTFEPLERDNFKRQLQFVTEQSNYPAQVSYPLQGLKP